MRNLLRYFLKPRRTITYKKYREQARELIHNRLSDLAPKCNVNFKRVAIRNQKRRWGSCSSLGNLNFNYKIIFLPPCLQDYIIVHELCHLKELNHSPRFWQEVETVLPEYKVHLHDLRLIEKCYGLNIANIHRARQEHSCSHCQRLETLV